MSDNGCATLSLTGDTNVFDSNNDCNNIVIQFNETSFEFRNNGTVLHNGKEIGKSQELVDEMLIFFKKANADELEQKIEFLSEQVHNAWWEEKKRQGFHAPIDCQYHDDFWEGKFEKSCDHCHTDMYPYYELPEHIKEYDRVTVRTVLAAIRKMEAL